MTSTINTEWIFLFIQDYLPRFPEDVLIQIFNKLTFDHLIDFFVYFGNIKNLLIRHYYSRKLYFILSDYQSVDQTSWDSEESEESTTEFDELVTFYGIQQVMRGMNTLSEVVPNKLVLHSGDNFEEVKSILRELNQTIEKVPELEIRISSYQLTTEDFYSLISLPNLTKLRLLNMDISFIKSRRREDYSALRSHPKLNEIVFLPFRGVNDWSGIEFPQILTSLALSYNPESDLSTLMIPTSLQRLDIHGCNLSFQVLQDKLPPNLTDLCLLLDCLKTITVDKLPIGLRKLDLTSNSLTRILYKGCRMPEWPPNLNKIKFGNNMLNDDALEVLNTIGWPEELAYLDISYNDISQIKHFESLPKSVQELDISGNPFIWSNEQVFEFPCNLKSLDMSECQLKDLQNIKFPTSLEMLELCENDITDILSYPYWSTLTNLRRLEISYNLISNFDNWLIPRSVCELKLRDNPIKNLTSMFPLFNPNYNSRIVELDLSICQLTKLEIDYLPPTLKSLDLSFNKFPETFVFPSIFKKLYHLHLAENKFTSIVFEDGENTKSCLLSLDLSNNFIFGNKPSTKEINEFYDYLEKNLGKVKERNRDVNSFHRIEPW